MANTNLRKQIQKEMKRRKISIPVMARKLECHPGTLYDFFAGRKALGANYLQDLLNQLGATITFSAKP